MRAVRWPVFAVVAALLASLAVVVTASPALAGPGGGHLVVRQSGLDFGLIPVQGNSAEQTVTVENTGSGPASNLAVADPQDPFSVTTNRCPSTLAAGASCTVGYQVVANAPGPLSASSAVTSDSGSATVALRATGNPIGLNGSLAVSPTTLDFGTVPVGTTSAPQNVIVTNTAHGALDFTVAGGGAGALFGGLTSCGGNPKTLDPGTTCYFQYTYTPTAVGPQTGGTSIDVTLQGVTRTVDITMTGTGVAPLTISPTSLDFGQVVDGTTSAPQQVVVTNTTGSPIGFSAAGGGAGIFGGATDCGGSPKVLAAGASCSFEYRYTPSKVGDETGGTRIGITPYVKGSPGTYAQSQAIAFHGTGVASEAVRTQPLTVSGTSFDFGSVGIGTTAPGQRVLVTNTSGAPVSFSVAGGGAGTFGGVTDCGGNPRTLAAGASCYLQYAFSPSVLGPVSGSTSITLSLYTGGSPDGRHVDAGFSFTGNGYVPLVVSGTAFDFGRVLDGETSAGQRMYVTNNSLGPVSFTIAGGGAGLFGGVTDCGGSPKVLAAGASCYLEYRYTPTAIADQTGSTSLDVIPWVGGRPGTVVSTAKVSFRGEGWGAPTMSSNVVSPNALDFGPVAVGQSKSLSTVLRNDGSDEITAVQVTQPGDPQFVATGGTCLLAPSLGPGGICSITYTFTPTAVGTTTEHSQAGAFGVPAKTVTLTGTGYVPTVSTPTPAPTPTPPPPGAPKAKPAVPPTVDVAVSTDLRTSARIVKTKARLRTSGGKELLVAFVEASGPAGARQRVESVRGGGLKWRLASRANPTAGTVEVWYAYANGRFDSQVSASLHISAGGSISVVAYRNAAKAPAAHTSASGKGRNVVGRLTARKTASLVFAAVHDTSANRRPRPPRGQSLVHWFNDARTRDSDWVQRVKVPVGAGTRVTISAPLPSSDRWAIVVVEIPGA